MHLTSILSLVQSIEKTPEAGEWKRADWTEAEGQVASSVNVTGHVTSPAQTQARGPQLLYIRGLQATSGTSQAVSITGVTSPPKPAS